MSIQDRFKRIIFLTWKFGLAGGLVYLFLGFLTSRVSRDPLGFELPADGPRGAAVSFPPVSADGFSASDFWRRFPEISPGALSVHSGRSHDAEGSLEEVAAAASATGLDWVVLGDHPRDWAQEPGVFEPRRIGGVQLSLGAEMVIEESGRTLVIGLDSVPRAWSGRLAPMADLAREAGGFTTIVHPRSPSYGESWKVPSVEGADAFEAFDVSEMARHRLASIWMPYHLVSLIVGIPTRRMDESLVRLWRERSNTPALLAYDSLRAVTQIGLTGGLNHHPKTRLRGKPFPGYEPFFRTVVNHLHLTEQLPGDPVAAQLVLSEAIRSGRMYVSIGWPQEADGFAFYGSAPVAEGTTELTEADPSSETDVQGSGADATQPEDADRLGGEESLMILPGGVHQIAIGDRLIVELPRLRRAELLVRLLRDGRTVDWLPAQGASRLEWVITEPGVYRVEVNRGGLDFGPIRLGLTPWLFSNPIEFTR